MHSLLRTRFQMTPELVNGKHVLENYPNHRWPNTAYVWLQERHMQASTPSHKFASSPCRNKQHQYCWPKLFPFTCWQFVLQAIAFWLPNLAEKHTKAGSIAIMQPWTRGSTFASSILEKSSVCCLVSGLLLICCRWAKGLICRRVRLSNYIYTYIHTHNREVR